MPLQVRPIAVSIAVAFFFVISLLGWFSGLSPFTCCKRALTGAVVSYVAATLAFNAINAILRSAIIESQIRNRQEKSSGTKH